MTEAVNRGRETMAAGPQRTPLPASRHSSTRNTPSRRLAPPHHSCCSRRPPVVAADARGQPSRTSLVRPTCCRQEGGAGRGRPPRRSLGSTSIAPRAPALRAFDLSECATLIRVASVRSGLRHRPSRGIYAHHSLRRSGRALIAGAPLRMASRGGTVLGLPLWGRCSWEGIGDRAPRDMVGGGFRRIETWG